MSEHICDLITFIKKHYLYFQRGIDESASDFYIFYFDRVANPPSPRYLGILMHTLGLKTIRKRSNGKTYRWYQISFDDLNASLSRISDIIHMEIMI